MAAINIIEIESDDDLVILDEIEDWSSTTQVRQEFKAQESPPKPATNEGNTSTSTSFSNKINLSSILSDVKKAGGGNITIEGDKIMINLT